MGRKARAAQRQDIVANKKVVVVAQCAGCKQTLPRPGFSSVKRIVVSVICPCLGLCIVVVTTGLPLAQWPEVLGSARLTGAAPEMPDASLPHPAG